MQVDRINVCIAGEKLCRENGLQIMFMPQGGRLRSIYVCADTGEVDQHTALLVTRGVKGNDDSICQKC